MTGIALRTTFVTFEIPFGLFTIIVGHATFCVVIAFNNVIARLRRLPRTPEEASSDLGADPFTTFRRVTMPGMSTALLAGGLLAFALSFDEIIVTNFTAGAGTQTIPMWILSAIQRPSRAAGRQRRGARADRPQRDPGLARDADLRRGDGRRAELTVRRYQRRAWSRMTRDGRHHRQRREGVEHRSGARPPGRHGSSPRPAPGRRWIRWLDPVRGVPDRRCGPAASPTALIRDLSAASRGGSIRP